LTRNGNSTRQEILTPDEFELKLESLVQECYSLGSSDLEVKYKTGTLLNQHLGDPATRNKRGAEVVKNAAGRLGITKSEISRTRWFAHLFSSVEDLKGRYSEVKSWAGVKDLLPGLKPKRSTPEPTLEGGGPDAGAKSRNANKIKVVKLKKADRLLIELQNLITGVKIHLTSVEQTDLQRKISDSAEKMRLCLTDEMQNYVSACISSDDSGSGLAPLTES